MINIYNLKKTLSIYDVAKIKAFTNVFVIPLFLAIITSNVLFIFGWWIFMKVIYRFVFPTKKINYLYFILYLKNAFYLILLLLILLFIVII